MVGGGGGGGGDDVVVVVVGGGGGGLTGTVVAGGGVTRGVGFVRATGLAFGAVVRATAGTSADDAPAGTRFEAVCA